jgi:hypothetical protein
METDRGEDRFGALRRNLLEESAELLADYRPSKDVIPVIDLPAMIAKALHPLSEAEDEVKQAQRFEAEQTWDAKIERAMITSELEVLSPVTLARLDAKCWLGDAVVERRSFVAWLRAHDGGAVANRLAAVGCADAPSPWPLARLEFQDQDLERTISSRGYDPQSLPKNKAGKPGVKSEVWQILKSKPAWTRHIFDHAWKRMLERLKSNGVSKSR